MFNFGLFNQRLLKHRIDRFKIDRFDIDGFSDVFRHLFHRALFLYQLFLDDRVSVGKLLLSFQRLTEKW